MSWVWLALLAPAIFTVVIFVDKYVVEHKVKDYRGMPIYGAVAASILGTGVWLFGGRPALSVHDSLLVLSSGALSIWGYAFYFKALSKNHGSLVLALLQLTPVFTLVLAYFLLGERLTSIQFLGFILVFSSIILLCVERVEEKLALNSAFWYMMAANVFFALASVAIKFTINLNGFVPVLVYESWGLALGGLVLFLSFGTIRRAFWESFHSVGPKILGIMFLNESIFIVSKAITFLAILLGPVALVSLLGSTQVFYGILYGVVLTLIAPRIFNENTTFRHLGKKLVLAGILLAGIYLLV